MIRKKLINAQPAPYPNTSGSESTSVVLFHTFLNRQLVKGYVTVMDKIPNSDGILTITGTDQIPVGRLDVQLKTLDRRKQKRPVFQCELELLSYAEDEMLPVILIVVDQFNKRAYWRHLDYSLLEELSPKIKASTIALPMLKEQFLDGTNHEYIDAWKVILEKTKAKYANYDFVDSQRTALLREMGRLNQRIVPAFSLNQAEIREIHIFLDILNNLYDCEFKTVKQILYFNFWKIGIAIATYKYDTATFFIIPQSLTDNSPLIKEVKDPGQIQRDEIFLEDGAISLQWSGDRNSIKDTPFKTALRNVCKDVFKVVGKIDLSITDEFAATEYLWAFVQAFHNFLGLSDENEHIATERLKVLLFAILPITIEQRVNFSGQVRDSNYSIDGYMGNKAKGYYNQILKAEVLITEGYLPKISVTLDSKTFDMKLVRFYLDYLIQLGIEKITPVYHDIKVPGSPNFGPWNGLIEENAFKNLKLILNAFTKVFPAFVHEKFAYLHRELELYREYQLIVYVWHFTPSKRAYVETYHCVTQQHIVNRFLLFRGDEENCPEELRSRQESPGSWFFTLDGVKYQILMKGSRTLWFMLDRFPLHSLMREELGEKLDQYFKSKGLTNTPYRQRFNR